MSAFLLRRLALVLPTLFFVSLIVFGLQLPLSGDAALAEAGAEREPAVAAFCAREYHLDDPRHGMPCGCAGGSPRNKLWWNAS